jgi:hypothetical protein
MLLCRLRTRVRQEKRVVRSGRAADAAGQPTGPADIARPGTGKRSLFYVYIFFSVCCGSGSARIHKSLSDPELLFNPGTKIIQKLVNFYTLNRLIIVK